jgi:hypothetical protein
VIWLTEILCWPRMFGADMRYEFFVALLFVVHLHLVNGFTDERAYRLKCPGTLGASPALKILAFDPDKFSLH